MRPFRVLVLLVVVVGTSSCLTGAVNYTPPAPTAALPTTVTVSRTRNDVWKDFIPRLAQTFFMINNIDQSSGLINISYAGDPETFIDCGQIVSRVKNARGERTYQFPGSRANQQYEVMSNGNLFGVDRTLSLDGRANVVLQETEPGITRATVSIRYVLTRRIQSRDVMGAMQSSSDNISFNTGARASFPASAATTTCQSSGALEQRILALFGP